MLIHGIFNYVSTLIHHSISSSFIKVKLLFRQRETLVSLGRNFSFILVKLNRMHCLTQQIKPTYPYFHIQKKPTLQ